MNLAYCNTVDLDYPNTFVPLALQKCSDKWICPDKW